MLTVVTTTRQLAPTKAAGSSRLSPAVVSGQPGAPPPRSPPLPRHEDWLLNFSIMPHDHQMYAGTFL